MGFPLVQLCSHISKTGTNSICQLKLRNFDVFNKVNLKNNSKTKSLIFSYLFFQIPFARSQIHLMELVDRVCKNFEDYAQVQTFSMNGRQ